MADGKVVGMPLAVVKVLSVAVLEVGAIIIVDGSHGSEVVNVVRGGMIVTPGSDAWLELEELVVVTGGGSVVSDGTVVLPVGTVLLPDIVVEVITDGSVVDVVLVPGSVIVVEVMTGGCEVDVSVAEAEMVEFVIGGCPGPVVVDSGGAVEVSVDVGGGSVTVGAVLVETPVLGPVMPVDGSRTLESTELISPSRELIGLLASVVLELVTMPVGAKRMEDELSVVVGVSEDDALVEVELGKTSEVVVEASATELLVVVGVLTELLLLLLLLRVDEDSSAVLVEDSLLELSAVLVLVLLSLVDVSVAEVLAVDVSVDEELSDEDELSAEELLSVEAEVDVSVDVSVEVSVELSVVELLAVVLSVVVESVVWVAAGGVTIIVLEMMMVVTLTSGSSVFGSELVVEPSCLLVVSVDELGVTLSCDVIVALVNWRLIWRGK